MADIWREKLIQKRVTSADRLKKAGLIVAVVLLAAAGLFIMPALLILAVAAGAGAYYLLQGLSVEYEYSYVNGDIDIDRIFAKSRRKKAASLDLQSLEILAPADSHALDTYRQNGNAKTLDYTSGDPNEKVVVGVYHTDGQTQVVSLELDREMIEDMYRAAPRKVDRECLA